MWKFLGVWKCPLLYIKWYSRLLCVKAANTATWSSTACEAAICSSPKQGYGCDIGFAYTQASPIATISLLLWLDRLARKLFPARRSSLCSTGTQWDPLQATVRLKYGVSKPQSATYPSYDVFFLESRRSNSHKPHMPHAVPACYLPALLAKRALQSDIVTGVLSLLEVLGGNKQDLRAYAEVKTMRDNVFNENTVRHSFNLWIHFRRFQGFQRRMWIHVRTVSRKLKRKTDAKPRTIATISQKVPACHDMSLKRELPIGVRKPTLPPRAVAHDRWGGPT